MLSCSVGCAWAQSPSATTPVSERDFLGEMPIVLSVSRLAQPLDETPGAVTILDREFIRMSGARDVADLLRLVPGFQSTNSFETDAPMVSYHGRNDDFSKRLQVLVDGRSVYSTALWLSGPGLQTLALDDIERIEILRGSNSASYGARAFLGVVNIVSRDVRTTIGNAVNLTSGENQTGDAGARIGLGYESTTYRLSADTRGDSGLRGAYGQNRLHRFNFSSHFESGDSSWDLRMGGLNIEAGRGKVGQYGDPFRVRSMGSQFAQLDWRKVLDTNQDIAVTLSHTENSYRDVFPFLDPNPAAANYYGVLLNFAALEISDVAGIQHTVRHSDTVRTVWGAEARRELLIFPIYFDVRKQVSTNFYRAFGNAEIRLTPAVIVNAGMLAEQSSIGGDSVSPRVMVNWHVVNGHTLRAGYSTAFRPPSPYEKYADVKYYDINGANPLVQKAMTGKVRSERIEVSELGYHLNSAANGLSGDVRLFDERVRDGIECPNDCVNTENYDITGAEYELQWMFRGGSRLMFTQTWTTISGTTEFRTKYGAAQEAASLAWMQTLGSGMSFTLLHNYANSIALMSLNDGSPNNKPYSIQRTDMRFAKEVKSGRSRVELALTLQNIDAPYRDGFKDFYFDRRALFSLRISN